jgi:hypothetical protein
MKDGKRGIFNSQLEADSNVTGANSELHFYVRDGRWPTMSLLFLRLYMVVF